MLLVHHADHLLPRDAERRTGGNGACGCQMQPAHAGQRLLSNEIPGGEKRDRGLPAFRRNDGESCAARLKIKDGVSRTSLRKEDLLGPQVDECSAHSCLLQNSGEVKGHASHIALFNEPFRMEPLSKQPGKVSGMESPHRFSYRAGARLGRYETREEPSRARCPSRPNGPCAMSR